LTDYLEFHGELIMLITAVVMFLLTILVLSIAFISRWQVQKREAYRSEKSDQLGNLIIRYISGEINVNQIESKLSRRLDYILLLELVTELDHSLDGKEEEKLQELMDIENIRNHFERRFESDEPILQAKACLYFSKKADIPVSILPKLVQLSAHEEPVLAYASTSVLVVHGDMKDKAFSIKNVLKNRRVSPMAVSDLLVQFTKNGNEYHEEEVFLLMSLIEDSDIPPERTALIIQILDELEYLLSLDFLWNYYLKLDFTTAHPDIFRALLDALSKFGKEEILDDVHRIFAVYDDPSLRQAAARSMGFFKKVVSLPILEWLLNDPDYMVKFEAALSIKKYEHVDFDNINPPGLSKKEWESLAGEVLSESKY
jgi:hypothetical protein